MPARLRAVGHSAAMLSMLAALTFILLFCAAEGRASVAPHLQEQGLAHPQPRPPVDGRPLRDKWTTRSRTWIKADGSLITRVFQRDVNVRGKDGNWQAIDGRLRRQGSRWVSEGSRFRAEVPTSLDDGPVRLEHGPAWLALQLQGADRQGVVSGNAASFAGVAPGVTARWSIQADAIKEDLILADAQAPSTFVFDVHLSDGLRLVERPNGELAAVQRAGRSSSFCLRPRSRTTPLGRWHRLDRSAFVQSAPQTGGVVRLTLSRRWLERPHRAFPVTIASDGLDADRPGLLPR